MNSSGVISRGGGFTEFESAWDLDVERIQSLRNCGPLFCACAPERQLPLTVVLHRTLPHVRRLRELDEHAPGCVFNRALEERTAGPDVWQDSILDAATPEDVVAFRLLARCVLSRAYTHAVVAGIGPTELVRTCVSIRAELETGCYLKSGRPLGKARPGAEIVCGIVSNIAPVASNDGPFPIVVWEVEKNGLASRPSCFFSDSSAVAHACRAISIFGRRIRGPYLLIGIRRRLLLVGVVLFPIVLSSDRFAPVDSEVERDLVRGYWSKACALLKPLRRRELNTIPADWRSKRGHLLPYRYRPDLLLHTDDGPTVVELKGFDQGIAGVAGEYAVSFAAKASYWRSLVEAGHCQFVTRIAREFRGTEREESR